MQTEERSSVPQTRPAVCNNNYDSALTSNGFHVWSCNAFDVVSSWPAQPTGAKTQLMNVL